MPKSILFTAFAALLLFTYACKEDDETPDPDPVVYDNYAMLKTGNYWIYEQFTVDSLGNATPTGIYDSCYIEKDTVIHGNTYYKMVRAPYLGMAPVILYLRDSLHYVVDYSGMRYFSSKDYTSVFDYGVISMEGDTIAERRMQMANPDVVIQVPAGNYTTSDCQIHYKMHAPYTMNGTNRFQHTRYAKNTGIVSETMPFFLSIPTYTERRLVRCYLN